MLHSTFNSNYFCKAPKKDKKKTTEVVWMDAEALDYITPQKNELCKYEENNLLRFQINVKYIYFMHRYHSFWQHYMR